MEIIKIEVDDVPFGYDCVICRQRYSSRTERNEHLEAHFIHKKCTDCDRLVILIGDLEFELHRPTHCTKFRQNNSIDNNDLKKLIAIERLKETVVDNDFSAGQNTLPLITDDNDDDTLNESLLKDDTDSGGDCRLSIVGDILPKEDTESLKQIIPSTRKRNRRKTAKKCENDSEEKKKDRIRKNRSAKLMECTQDGCTEQFRQQQLLRKHLKNVHGVVEKHLCSICNFSFSDKSNLKHHMVTHTDDKRFICSFCGARFHKLTNMTEHMNAHMGLKPYKCEICGKDFGRSNHKRQHMRVHTGEKPYGCQINECTRAYMFKIDLKRHQRSVHGIIEKTFPCQICSKVFYENKYLTKHLATAHA